MKVKTCSKETLFCYYHVKKWISDFYLYIYFVSDNMQGLILKEAADAAWNFVTLQTLFAKIQINEKTGKVVFYQHTD